MALPVKMTRGFGVLEFWSTGVLEYWSFGKSQTPKIKL
jgi:hypothetical protein